MSFKRRLTNCLPEQTYLRLRRLQYQLSKPARFAQMQARRNIVTSRGYSLRPFDERRAIFVHVPKCAGISVSQALFGNLGGGHSTLDDYLVIFEPSAIARYFKFAFVRNPWDRLVSAYCFLTAGGVNDDDRKWAAAALSPYGDFGDFVRRWLNRSNVWKWYHFMPQYHFLLDRGRRVALDFVGLFENLEEDFAHVARRIGVNCHLPRENTGAHRAYTDFYTDELRDIVADVYAEDIALLGYAFDNSSLQSQLAQRATAL